MRCSKPPGSSAAQPPPCSTSCWLKVLALSQDFDFCGTRQVRTTLDEHCGIGCGGTASKRSGNDVKTSAESAGRCGIWGFWGRIASKSSIQADCVFSIRVFFPDSQCPAQCQNPGRRNLHKHSDSYRRMQWQWLWWAKTMCLETCSTMLRFLHQCYQMRWQTSRTGRGNSLEADLYVTKF